MPFASASWLYPVKQIAYYKTSLVILFITTIEACGNSISSNFYHFRMDLLAVLKWVYFVDASSEQFYSLPATTASFIWKQIQLV
jgi:hypothetical protein